MVRVLQTKALWAAVAIVSMWRAVVFTGIYGSDIVNDAAASHTTVPIAVAVAGFAALGSSVVGWFGFRGGDGGADELEALRRDVAELREARGAADAKPQAPVG